MMKYRKITKEQVLNILIQCHISIMNPTDVISVPNIAYLLKTSEYQVRKHINELKQEGLVQVGYFPKSCLDDEMTLPLKGFCITSKARESEQYKIAEKQEKEIIKKSFTL